MQERSVCFHEEPLGQFNDVALGALIVCAVSFAVEVSQVFFDELQLPRLKSQI